MCKECFVFYCQRKTQCGFCLTHVTVCMCDCDAWFFSSSKPVYPFAVHYFKGKVLHALCVLFCLTDQNNGRSHSLPDFRIPIHTHSLEAAFVVYCWVSFLSPSLCLLQHHLCNTAHANSGRSSEEAIVINFLTLPVLLPADFAFFLHGRQTGRAAKKAFPFCCFPGRIAWSWCSGDKKIFRTRYLA